MGGGGLYSEVQDIMVMVVTWGPCEQTDTCKNITSPNIGSKIIVLKLLLSATG